MTALDQEIQWYLARDGKQHGPLSDPEMRKLVELGHLRAADLLWRSGFSDWRPAVTVFPMLADATLPQPPSGQGQAKPDAASQQAALHASKPQPAQPLFPDINAPPRSQRGAVERLSEKLPDNAPSKASESAPRPAASEARSSREQPARDLRPGPSLDRPLERQPDRTAGRAARSPTTGTVVNPAAQGPRGAPGPGGSFVPMGSQSSRGRQASRPSGLRTFVVSTTVLAIVAGGAWLGYKYKDPLLSFVRRETAPKSDKAPQEAEAKSETKAAVAAALAPVASKEPAAAVAPLAAHTTIAAAAAQPTAADLDAELQTHPLWTALKQEFPEWYGVRLNEAARLGSEGKSQADITRHLVDAIVALRRDNSQFALSASREKHKALATAFLDNLKALSADSGDDCYDFISKGEASTAIVTRLQTREKSAPIEAQVLAVISAITDGRKSPVSHTAPGKADYDVLAAELTRIGWTQADMQLFADPRALARAPRDRVCTMLRDWFTAHLTIPDASVQERLLFESLKPVISG
ncbi:MAG: GYF domain-containing protein [Hyphomicrobium sp.]